MITSIKQIMTEKIVCVPMGTSLFEAHEIMREKRFRHLPIVDTNHNVVGVLSQRDLQYVPDSKNLTVEMFMTSPIASVDTSMPLRNAILILLENKISSLLITDAEETVVGIVTTDDILWHLAHLLADEKSQHKSIPLPDVQTIGIVAHQVAQTGI